jgi:tricorn protease
MIVVMTLIFSFNINAQNAYFTMNPTLTPDAKTVIFSYEGDLWKVPVDGGNAFRITAMDGVETNPSVSPDGKWLAFSSNQYGNYDVYIMPLEGGNIEQLTFHESGDKVSSWSWDSKTIYFTSSRQNSIATYSIKTEGGTPIRLMNHYFNTVHNVVEHPLTGELFFNESWESNSFAHRKRYKGDYNPDIKSYNPKTKEYKTYTSYIGKDFGATVDRDGSIYFKSDEANGEYNLYTFKNEKKTQLTKFSSSIMWPKVSANGKKVVFYKDYQLCVYDVKSGKSETLKVNTFTNNPLGKEIAYNTSGKISYFDVSPDEKKLAFVSRGRLFVSDIKGKFIKELPTDNKEAVGEVKWLNDRSLIFSQSYKGYYNWFTIDANGNGEIKQITKVLMTNRMLALNSDRTKGVYYSGRNNVCLMDLKSFKSEVIVEEELWGLYNPIPSFSPDDKYIVFNAIRDFEDDVFVYNIETGIKTNLTNTKVTESDPIWSPDGKYIYFASDRINPGYPYGTKDSKIYQMALDKYIAPFRADKFDKLFEEEKKSGEEKSEGKSEEKEKDKKKGKADKDSDKKDKSDEKEKPEIKINTKSIMERVKSISPRFGQQRKPSILKKGDKTYILYLSDHSEGKGQLWKTTITPFEKNKIERVSTKSIYSYQLVAAKKGIYILISGKINTLNIEGNKLKEISISHNFNKSLEEEFNQIFHETWAGMEENFYNEDFHGEDWKKLKKKYEKYLPYVTSRANLSTILNDMLGELNTSHFGFSSYGKEEKVYHGTVSLATGILFNNENPFIVDRIVKEGPADYIEVDIKKGDRLVAVDDVRIDESVNREYYFAKPKRASEIKLTFERDKKEFHVQIHPSSSYFVRTKLYDEWQDDNQEYVDLKSNERIAYVHMKDMGGNELQKFKEDLVSAEAHKEALILDLRYNTGGNVHNEVLEFISQRKYLNWKYREGKLTGQSNFDYGNKPIVLLINEQSLSDAEMTAAGFKELGLGTIVGTETYRWIIFTSGKMLVDGSFFRLPSWGCYTLNGDNLELSGVSPDVYVDKNLKDRMEGNYTQLDKAIEIILEKLD